jgi:hypothetical protein
MILAMHSEALEELRNAALYYESVESVAHRAREPGYWRRRE